MSYGHENGCPHPSYPCNCKMSDGVLEVGRLKKIEELAEAATPGERCLTFQDPEGFPCVFLDDTKLKDLTIADLNFMDAMTQETVLAMAATIRRLYDTIDKSVKDSSIYGHHVRLRKALEQTREEWAYEKPLEHDKHCAIDPKTGDYKKGIDPSNTNYICRSCLDRAINNVPK